MARPLSEEKRQAILAAAAGLVAQLGTGAPTAKIARAAGVAEGTVFTYFPTKDDLLNQLLLEIETDLVTAVSAWPADGTPRERIRHVWDRLIDWSVANPTGRQALRQLKLSDRITGETRQRCEALFRDIGAMVEQALAGHIDPARAAFYLGTVLVGLADTVSAAIAASPKDREQFKQAGFDLFWKGCTV